MSNLVSYDASKHRVLNSKLLEMEQNLEDLAMANLQEAMTSGSYTGPELLAMKEFEKLQLMKDYDLGGILIKGKIIRTIEQNNLWTVHPENFRNLREAAVYYGPQLF
jgi:hypothetical protein